MRPTFLRFPFLLLACLLLVASATDTMPRAIEDHMKRVKMDDEERLLMRDLVGRQPQPFYDDWFFLFLTFVVLVMIGKLTGPDFGILECPKNLGNATH